MNCGDLDSSLAMELLIHSFAVFVVLTYDSSLRPMGSRVILVARYASCMI